MRIRVGDIYEDCFGHPCLVTVSSKRNGEICGMSLIDGSGPRYSSFSNCGPVKMTNRSAMDRRKNWKTFYAPVEKMMKETGWWDKRRNYLKVADWKVICRTIEGVGLAGKIKQLERYLG